MAFAGVERGHMKSEDGEKIQKYSPEIEQGIEAMDLTGFMFSRNIITMEERHRIDACNSKIERAKLFMNIITFRGPTAFNVFLESLNSYGYRDLYVKLGGTLSPTGDPRASRQDNSNSPSLSDVLYNLEKRVSSIEKILKDLMGKVQETLKKGFESLTSTLQRIEELTQESHESRKTIDRLLLQLEDKERLLKFANDEIENLKGKVSRLEDENNKLSKVVDMLEHQQWNDRAAAQKNHDRLEKKIAESETARKQEKKDAEKDREEMEAKRKSDKMEMEAQRKKDKVEMEAQRRKDKVEMEAKRKKDKVEMEAKRKKDKEEMAKAQKEEFAHMLKVLKDSGLKTGSTQDTCRSNTTNQDLQRKSQPKRQKNPIGSAKHRFQDTK